MNSLIALTFALSAATGSILMPHAADTPGATNPAVTQSTIGTTICRTGYTATIRPTSSYTTKLKKAQLAGAYRDLAATYGAATGNYEEDHLISLELGGAASDPKNLWPEPYATSTGARIKDKVENKLHTLVCSHQITLAVAQKAIATNWYAAYLKYVN